MKRLAIDFGSENSMAVLNDDGKIILIRDIGMTDNSSVSAKLIPSYITFNEEGKPLYIGKQAKINGQYENTLFGFKRFIGVQYESIKNKGLLEILEKQFDIIPDWQTGLLTYQVNNHEFTPQELTTIIFRHIKELTENQVNQTFSEVVLTAPAYFDASQISFLKMAALDAGFESVSIVSEPVAALVATKKKVNDGNIVFCFDIGAGTTDISLGYTHFQNDEVEFEIIKNTGLLYCGGIDIDNRICDYIRANAKKSVLNERELLQLAEKAKIELSEKAFATIRLGDNETIYLTIGELNSKISDLVGKCRELIQEVFFETGLKFTDVDDIVLIGGPIILPVFRDLLLGVFSGSNLNITAQILKFYAKNSTDPQNRFLSTAIGASYYSTFIDRCPFGYGYEQTCVNEENITLIPEILIPVNSKYPTPPTRALLGYMSTTGLYAVKILKVFKDHNSIEKVLQINVLRIALQDPENVIMCIEMGLTSDKELWVIISNLMSDKETFIYKGVDIESCIEIPTSYPLVKQREKVQEYQLPYLEIPDDEAIQSFREWIIEPFGLTLFHCLGSVKGSYNTSVSLLKADLNHLCSDAGNLWYTMLFSHALSVFHNINAQGLIDIETKSGLENELGRWQERLFKLHD